jgi:hypothetical protein
MSKLPQAHELPNAPEPYDPARVEEAFATFAERVHELESVAAELRAELRSLRSERSAPQRFDDEAWPAEYAAGGLSPEWVAAVPPPLAHDLTMSRLGLELVFLLVVALLAGLADLSAGWIVLVMTAAWGLVALSEWAAAAKRARWRLEEIPPPLEEDRSETTGPWSMPVVEATAVAAGSDPESQTIVAKLPAEAADSETGPEADAADPAPAPARRSRLRPWRRRPAEVQAADPWET